MIKHSSGLLATINDKGLIDTGDTANNEAFFRIALELKRRSNLPVYFGGDVVSDQEYIQTVVCPDGYILRSPEIEMNYGKFLPSRDTWLMVMCFLRLIKQDVRLANSLGWIRGNGFKYPNNDVFGPELWLLVSLNSVSDHVWRFFTDLWLIGNSLNRCGWLPRYQHDFDYGNGKRGGKWHWGAKPTDTGDDKLHLATLLVARFCSPTKLSRFAMWIYFKYRPMPESVLGYATRPSHWAKSSVIAALYHYFRTESGNNEEIAYEWDDVLRVLTRVI